MGTSGVPWVVDKGLIKDTIKKLDGKVSRIAPALDCTVTTLLRHINADPELKEYLAHARHGFLERMMDKAEDALEYALDIKEDDVGNALKSAFYVLNNQGKERGYSPTEVQAADKLKSFGTEANDLMKCPRPSLADIDKTSQS